MTTANGTPQAPASGAPASQATSQPGQKTAEQLATELANKTAALSEERERARMLKEEVEILKGSRTSNTPSQPSGYEAPPAADHMRQLNEMWETDPRKAMQTELQMALRWFDQASAQLEIQADDVAKKFKDFSTYRSDVFRHLRSMPMESRNRPGVVEAAYYYIKGQQADTLVNLSKEELIAKIRAGETVQGLDGAMPGGAPPKRDPAAPTPDQIAAARAMGQTIEEYMKHIR